MLCRNNRGSTLVNVVLCILFISMLGVALVGTTINNVKLQQKQKQEDEIFYECETALDEITTGVKMQAYDSIQESYLLTLKAYTTETDLNTFYSTKCKEKLKNKLGNTNIVNTLKSYLSTDIRDKIAISVGSIDEATPQIVTIKDVCLEYTKVSPTTGKEKKVSISTDLEIKFPELAVATISSSVGGTMPIYEKYAIIAENGVECKNSMSTVRGNVYAGGKGILVDEMNTVLSLCSDNLIIDGDLTASNQSILQVRNFDSGARPSLWAKNIITTTSNSSTARYTQILLNGKDGEGMNCYVKDDMKLDAIYSKIDMVGDYIGYTSSTAEDGSSILLNGANSILNIGNAGNTLALGGYAYIGFQQNRLSTKNSVDSNKLPVACDYSDAGKKGVILTADSLGIKSNQLMYRIPEEKMKSLGTGLSASNPMPYALCKTKLDSGAIGDIIDIGAVETYYDNPTNYHIQPIIYRNRAGTDDEANDIVYFYICFNTDTADNVSSVKDFEIKYQTNYSDWGTLGSTSFKLGGVTIGADKLYADGYLYTYSSGATVSQARLTTQQFNELTNIHDFNISDLSTTFSNLSKTLTTNELTTETTNPYQYYIKDPLNTYDSKILDDYTFDGSATSYRYHLVATNGDYVVQNPERGIIISDGNVTVKKDFEGIIFAKGMVTIADGANVTCNATNLKDMLAHAESYFKDNFINVSNLPSMPSGYSGSSEAINLNQLVTYRNWKKR